MRIAVVMFDAIISNGCIAFTRQVFVVADVDRSVIHNRQSMLRGGINYIMSNIEPDNVGLDFKSKSD